jgi:hypothetical protein
VVDAVMKKLQKGTVPIKKIKKSQVLSNQLGSGQK